MAEIKIEEKSTVWPWIVLAIVVIGVLVYFFAFHGDDDDTNDRRDEQTEQNRDEMGEARRAAPNISAVTAYVSFIIVSDTDSDSMGLDHEYTHEALLKLTHATRAMAEEIGYDIQKDMGEVKTQADKITRDPYETSHAKSIRKSAETLAKVLKHVQQNAFPDLATEADGVKNAAQAIDPDALTLDQREEVKNFFMESARMLEKMNNYPPQI